MQTEQAGDGERKLYCAEFILEDININICILYHSWTIILLNNMGI